MNAALWSVTGLLTAVYLLSGLVKLLIPREKIAGMTHAGEWVLTFPDGAIRGIGAVEILGAIGLLLPALLDIAPVLVPLAALGLVLTMTGAVILRIRRHEPTLMLVDLTYLTLAAFVMIGRFA